MKKNLNIPDDMHQWYEEKAKSLNIPTTAIMIIALNDYMRQDSALKTMNDVMFEVNNAKFKGIE